MNELLKSAVFNDRMDIIDYVLDNISPKTDVIYDLCIIAIENNEYHVIRYMQDTGITEFPSCRKLLGNNYNIDIEALQILYNNYEFLFEEDKYNDFETSAISYGRLDILQWICRVDPTRELTSHHIYSCLFNDYVDMYKFILDYTGKIPIKEHLQIAKAFESVNLVSHLGTLNIF